MRSEVLPEVAWTCLAAVAATALFHYHLLVYLAIFVLAVLGGGIPWMATGTTEDKRIARIAVIGVTAGGVLGFAWLLADRWVEAVLA